MPLYRKRGRIILFVHIPKTGGSTIEETLCKCGARQALKHHRRLGYAACTPQHIHFEIYKHFIGGRFYDYALTVVRNPFARIASEYKWRSRISKQPLPGFDEWIRQTFETVRDSPYLYDNHIRLQSEFISERVEVFKLEDGLEAPIRAALTALGMSQEQPEVHSAKKSDADAIEVDAETVERIRAFYHDDFVKFGYAPEKVPGSFRIRPGGAVNSDPQR